MHIQRIVMGGDHAGVALKSYLAEHAPRTCHIEDLGPVSSDSVDYPDFAHPVAEQVAQAGDRTVGVLICGSGNGVCMTANKHPNIRAALCWSPELAALARAHNDANILCLPARFIDQELALDILRQFLDTPFEGGRHQRRVEKIPEMES